MIHIKNDLPAIIDMLPCCGNMEGTGQITILFMIDLHMKHIMNLNTLSIVIYDFKMLYRICFAIKHGNNFSILAATTSISTTYHDCVLRDKI